MIENTIEIHAPLKKLSRKQRKLQVYVTIDFHQPISIFVGRTPIYFWIFSSWSSGNVFVSGAENLRFKSRAGQIGHSVANGSPPLRHFFERSCAARAQ